MKRILPILLFAVVLLFFARTGDAGSPRRVRGWTHAHDHKTSNQQCWCRPNPYDVYRAMYPKYYYGFHVRHFQQLGIPHGDRMIRGLPW